MESILRFELDNDGKKGVTLAKFNSLNAMDEFISRFKDSNEVKKEYLNKINDFLQNDLAMQFLIDNYNKKENNGYLRMYAYDGREYRLVPIIYQSSLINEKDAIKKLEEAMQKDSFLREIYNRKLYILPPPPTNYLKDELCRALFRNGTKNVFIKEFMRYFKSLDIDKRYFILRSLCVKANLLDIPKERGKNIYHIKRDFLNRGNDSFTLVKINHYSFGDYTDEELEEFDKKNDKLQLREEGNEKLNDVIKKNDIDKLLENYDLDEIDRNTNYFDIIQKTKKRGK